MLGGMEPCRLDFGREDFLALRWWDKEIQRESHRSHVIHISYIKYTVPV